MKNLYLGVGPRPIHVQHIEAMEKLAPMADFSEWDLIDKYIKDAGILNYDATVLPYDDTSVDTIYTSHLLEHFGFKEAQSALVEWYRVLKVGGKIMINVPDMDWASEQILSFTGALTNQIGKNSTLFNTPQMIMEVIYGNQDHEGEFHKSGYTKKSLKLLLEKVGFKKIEIQKEYEAHLMGCLIAKAEKKHD